MITLGGVVQVSDYESISLESAFTQRDDNLYSEVDDLDNDGRAVFLSLKSDGRGAFLNGYTFQSTVSMEYDQQDFTFIDRYRLPLFDRDWNFDLTNAENSEDLIVFGSFGLVKDASNNISLTVNRRKRGRVVDGWQNQLDFNQEFGDFRITSRHFRLENKQGEASSSWIRSKADLQFTKWKIAPGINYEIDENKTVARDTVVSTLMNFRATEFYLASGDSSSSSFRFGYLMRQDRLPVAGELQDYLTSRNIRGSYSKSLERGRLAFDVNYRSVDDQLGRNEGEDEVINGRVNWNQSFFDRAISHTFSYSTGNARELRREFIYLPVNTGEGTHTWRDLNEDGVQDLNEFFEAINPDERNHVKIFTPTDEYTTSFQTFYLHTIDIRAPINWINQGGLRSFVSKFALNINLNTNFKTTSSDYWDRLNPLAIDLASEDIISTIDSKRYTIFFNRNGRGLGMDFTRQTNDNKQLLTQGFELRERNDWITNFKVDIASDYTFRLTSSFGGQLNQSDFLESRNFDIRSSMYKPQLIWQPTNFLRLIGSYERRNRANEFSELSNESAITQSYTGELTWNQAGKGSVRATFSFLDINFQGDPATYLGYILLDGLQPGNNQTWQVNIQQRLSKGMQLSLLYNGRNSQNARVIHTGSVQVTAFF